MSKNLNDLVGKSMGFYGVDSNYFKIGSHVFEVREDPDDGYRSAMRDVLEVFPKEFPESWVKPIFFSNRVATVEVEVFNDVDFEGYQLVDVDTGYVWLTFGTDYHDSYYPCFVFEYTPERGSK